jgi:carbonic anhydrase
VCDVVEQNPYAVVVTCADSRVAPELIFDEGMGFLFVIRYVGLSVIRPTAQLYHADT